MPQRTLVRRLDVDEVDVHPVYDFLVGNPGLRRGSAGAVAVLLLLTASAVASTRIRVYSNPAVIQGLTVRPATLTMTADGNDTITGLRWIGWGSAVARANGINHVNNCVPSCVAGHVRKVRVSVRLFNRGLYRGKYVYRCYAVSPGARFLRRFCLP